MTDSSDEFPIAIIGAGFSGLGMAIELQEAGIESFTIYEAADEIGGTWRENTYPGCACDIPSHLYSFSYEPKSDWTQNYSRQPEILDYLKDVADKYDLYDNIAFETEIASAHFDRKTGLWTLVTTDGAEHVARAVALGIGPLARPKIPDIPGLDDFDGEWFHSAEWNHDYDLSGKRVAAVGTGASAIQFVPQIADEVDALHVLQRTPPWVSPKPARTFSELEKMAFDKVPGLRWMYRNLLYWLHESRAVGFVSEPKVMKAFEWFTQMYIDDCFGDDPEMRERVTPDYTMGCKRILMSNDYYPALKKDHVELHDEALAEMEEDAIVTASGERREVDAVIFGTGFHVTDFLSHFEVTGLGGRKLNDAWQNGAEAYYGMAVAGFPNFYIMLGPNTGLGHNSVVFMIESQTRYIRQCIEHLMRRDATWMDVRPAPHRDFNERLQDRMLQSVWKSGCESWYLEDNGKNTTIWPGYTVEYWLKTLEMDETDFRMAWEASA